MNTAVVIAKVEPKVKKQAQKVAEEFGFSLSSLINAYLRQLVRTKEVTFGVREEPTEYLLKMLQESEEDIKAGRMSPAFDNGQDAIAWLNNPKRKYASQVQQKIQQTAR